MSAHKHDEDSRRCDRGSRRWTARSWSAKFRRRSRFAGYPSAFFLNVGIEGMLPGCQCIVLAS
jgi:hypothetical protein